MAKFDYGPITQAALRLINSFGTDIYLIRDSNTTWEKKYDRTLLQEYWENTTSGFISYDEPDMDSYLGDGVITKYKVEEIDGHLIKQSDKKIVATEIPAPMLGDKILVGSTEYKYVSHITVAPNNVIILYIIQVRI